MIKTSFEPHTHTHTHIYIYIYIYREREREREGDAEYLNTHPAFSEVCRDKI